MTPTVLFLDIDDTVVFGRRRLDTWSQDVVREHDFRPVDRTAGRTVGYTTIAIIEALAAAQSRGVQVVPVTARSLTQWRRLALPTVGNAALIVSGGSEVFTNGRRDRDWEAIVASHERASTVAPHEVLNRASAWGIAATLRSDRWCVVKHHTLDDAEKHCAQLSEELRSTGWAVGRDGSRVYVGLADVTKGAAARFVAQVLRPTVIAAAGDSELDRPLVDMAHVSFVPRHGELARDSSLLRRPGITSSEDAASGVATWINSLPT